MEAVPLIPARTPPPSRAFTSCSGAGHVHLIVAPGEACPVAACQAGRARDAAKVVLTVSTDPRVRAGGDSDAVCISQLAAGHGCQCSQCEAIVAGIPAHHWAPHGLGVRQEPALGGGDAPARYALQSKRHRRRRCRANDGGAGRPVDFNIWTGYYDTEGCTGPPVRSCWHAWHYIGAQVCDSSMQDSTAQHAPRSYLSCWRM